jgi:hypothetical protein
VTLPRPSARGLLLVHADVGRAADWAAAGVVAVHVGALDSGWSAILPADARAATGSPYDDPVAMLLGRALPRRLCGAIGVAQVGPRLVLAVVPKVLRPRRRWLVWEPGRGLVRVTNLTPATVADLAATAGRREAGPALARVLRDGRGDALRVLHDTFEVIGLPGADLAAGEADPTLLPEAQRVDPKLRMVQWFDRAAREDLRWRSEVEGHR